MKKVNWTLIGILSVVIIILVGINKCTLNKVKQKTETITTINVENSYLKKDKRILQDSLTKETIARKALQQASIGIIKDRDKYINENKILRQHLSNIVDLVNNIPADSSYAFLDVIAYPFNGEKKYPFNEPQVKAIHTTYLEHDQLGKIVENQDSSLLNCRQNIENAEAIGNSFKKSLALSELQVQKDSLIIANVLAKEKLYEKENKKLNRKVTFYKITTGIGIVVALIIAL